MRILLLCCLLAPMFCLGQNNYDYKKTEDSIAYYNRTISTMFRGMYDSLRNSEAYTHAQERIRVLTGRSDSYGSFNLFLEVAHAEFDELNESLSAKGYTTLKDPALRFGFGFTNKFERAVVDFTWVAIGFTKKARKGDEKVGTSFSNGLMLDIGYDFLKSQKFNVYPYAGISWRLSNIDYSKPAEINPNYTDITDFLLNKTSTSGVSSKFGYQAGLGLEFAFKHSRSSNGGYILFVKGGTNRVIGDMRYKIEGVRYNPGIEYGDWILGFGVKFFGRR